MLIFLGGSAGLRGYINFILDHNHAYGTLAAPIAALLFFFVLALGVLLGSGVPTAAIETVAPTADNEATPRVLNPRWLAERRNATPVGESRRDRQTMTGASARQAVVRSSLRWVHTGAPGLSMPSSPGSIRAAPDACTIAPVTALSTIWFFRT